MLDRGGKEFIKQASRHFETSLYRFDKYNLLDWFMSEILSRRFHLPNMANNTPDPDAVPLINQMVEEYFVAVKQSDPFSDILGPLYMEIQSNWRGSKPLGEYYTPPEVSELMSEMSISGIEFSGYRERPYALSDPCVGSGAMPLAFFRTVMKHHGPEALKNVSFTGIDISYNGIRLCTIQMLANIIIHDLALAEVALVQGNSLLMDVEAMTVILNATHGDSGVIPSPDPRRVLLANKDQLRGSAETHYLALQAQGVCLTEIETGKALIEEIEA